MRLLREIDPEDTQMRPTRHQQRSQYRSPGPDHCWHVGGYDKLKSYRLPIKGCFDGILKVFYKDFFFFSSFKEFWFF